jgi:DNA-binding IclR family transcriptional regulator
MHKSTVHHIIKALHNEGVLVRTTSRKYRLSSRLLGWGNIVSEQYKTYYNAVPYLDELVKKTGETVHLAVKENNSISYLAKIEPQRPVRIKTTVGSSAPLHCTGLGKVLLAYEMDHNHSKILKWKLEKYTENTIVNNEELMNELKLIKEKGYGIDNEEYEVGLYCISAPIKDFMGNTVCAISVSGPEFRMKKNHHLLTSNLLRTAGKITAQCDFFVAN